MPIMTMDQALKNIQDQVKAGLRLDSKVDQINDYDVRRATMNAGRGFRRGGRF